MEGLLKENLRSSCAQMRYGRGHVTLSLSSNTLFEPTSRSLRAQTPLNVVSALEALITCVMLTPRSNGENSALGAQ